MIRHITKTPEDNGVDEELTSEQERIFKGLFVGDINDNAVKQELLKKTKDIEMFIYNDKIFVYIFNWLTTDLEEIYIYDKLKDFIDDWKNRL